MMSMLNEHVDLSLAQKDGWFYRRGLRSADLHLVRENYNDDEYRLRDVRPQPGKRFVVIDVGACIGSFSRLVLDKFPESFVVAVEANPLNIEVLRKNIEKYPDRSAIVKAAVTYEPGELGLLDSLYVGTTASGGSRVEPIEVVRAEPDDGLYIKRPSPLRKITLEQIIELYELDHIDMLKLDCEGSEHSILRGAAPVTLDRVRLIAGEYHGGLARWRRLVADVFAPRGWRHVSWNHHDHMGLFWL